MENLKKCVDHMTGIVNETHHYHISSE